MATTTAQPIKVRESVRKYEALVAPALEPREEEEEVSIETNARFPVRDLRLIYERAEGPLGIRDSPSAFVDSECVTCEPLGFVVYDPSATPTVTAVALATTTSSAADATTISATAPAPTTSAATTSATTTATITITTQQSAAIRASAVAKTPTPPPSKAPRAPHPLACVFHATAAAAAAPTTQQPVQAGATPAVSIAYAAYVKQLVAVKKTDVSVAAARVSLRIQQVEKAAASVDDSPLASALRGLVLDASFLGHTAHHHVLLLSKQLECASKWVHDADTRAVAMSKKLLARECEVAMLRQALAIAQQENGAKKEKVEAAASASATASVMASAPTTTKTNDQEKDLDKTVEATAAMAVAPQDPNTGTVSGTSDTWPDAEIKNEDKSDDEVDGDDDSSSVIEHKRRWAKLHDVQRKQRLALETILAKARAMTESVESGGADASFSHNGDCDGETVIMENAKSNDRSSCENSGASQHGDDEYEGTADINLAVPASAPPSAAPVPMPNEAPTPTRHIVQPKIHVTRRCASASMVETINTTRWTASQPTSPSRCSLLAPGWALVGVEPVLPRTRAAATATALTATQASSTTGIPTTSVSGFASAPRAGASGRPAGTVSKKAKTKTKTKAKPVEQQPRHWRS